MKCWICKKGILKASVVHYTDGIKEKARDICGDCYPKLKFNDCHYVEVNKL